MDTRPPAAGPSRWRRRLRLAALVVFLVGVPLGAGVWYKLLRDVPQPAWITSDDAKNFLYGSVGAEGQAGIPYWLVITLPRIFGRDYLPGPGGYASLGLPWEEGQELPTGFVKKTIGFERVGFNCALCHTTQYRMRETDRPTFVAAGTSQTSDVGGLIEFFGRSAADPRFNADTILKEIDLATRLSATDRLLYRYLLIPMAKKQMLELGNDYMGWVKKRAAWGPGRDAPFNLTKFVLLKEPDDGSVDNTDFPAIWNLQSREQAGRIWPESGYDASTANFSQAPVDQSKLMMMSLAGDTTSFRSVAIDAALGLKATKTPFFMHRMETLITYLRTAPVPRYPAPLPDAALAGAGAALFEQHCANCHASGRDNRMGTVIPLAQVGTDAERTHAWTRTAADGINKIVMGFGIYRSPMSKPDNPGYTAMHMDGLWLRGPYLHNGSVPTLRALLEPPACRPQVFYRGSDLVDQDHVGFVSLRCGEPPPPVLPGCAPVPVQSGCMPPDKGFRLDTRERGNGNGGHTFGTTLPEADKAALVAYLRTQ